MKPKPKAVNKPSPHPLVHGLVKPGVFQSPFFAPIHPAARSEAALDRCESQHQTLEAAKTARQVQGMFLYRMRGFALVKLRSG